MSSRRARSGSLSVDWEFGDAAVVRFEEAFGAGVASGELGGDFLELIGDLLVGERHPPG